MLAGNERETLLRVADQLSAELGWSERGEVPGAISGLGRESAMVGILNSEDELLLAEIRRRLEKIAAAALDGGELSEAEANAIGATLDGAEMVMRGEIMIGNAGQIPALLPSFVFLVALTVVDQDRALELSKRCALLVEQAF